MRRRAARGNPTIASDSVVGVNDIKTVGHGTAIVPRKRVVSFLSRGWGLGIRVWGFGVWGWGGVWGG